MALIGLIASSTACSSGQGEQALWSPLRSDHNYKWSQNAEVETHLAVMPGGEECRGKMLGMLNAVEGGWNAIGSPLSPVFVQDHEERHSHLNYHTRQGGPIWGQGVERGEIVVFSSTDEQIKKAMGENTAAFHYLSHSGEEIVGGFIVFREDYVNRYCSGEDEESLKQLAGHELGHMLGLGHAEGSVLMRDSLSVEGGVAAVPEMSKEGAGLRWVYQN